MAGSHADYWRLRLEQCKRALEDNNFEAFLTDSPGSARDVIMAEIVPKIEVKSASWGDSMPLHSTGILGDLKRAPDIHVIETFDNLVPREEIVERRRKALLVDLFLTGANAVTETGQLVNLDMVGNRVAGITFGPRNVVIVVGRNKIVADIQEAMQRIKNFSAPANAIRHPGFNTPCIKTSRCMDCKSPDHICNSWMITEKSFPKGRIKVVLINQDLGL